MSEFGTEAESATRGRPERAVRERSVVATLRQPWLALSTYRLYPENPDRPGFAPALERVATAPARLWPRGRSTSRSGVARSSRKANRSRGTTPWTGWPGRASNGASSG